MYKLSSINFAGAFLASKDCEKGNYRVVSGFLIIALRR